MDLITVIPWFVLGNSIYLFLVMSRRFWKQDIIAWEWMIVSGVLAVFSGALIALKRGPAGGLVGEEWSWICLALFLLLFIGPAVLMRFIQRSQDKQSYVTAWVLNSIALILHPFPSSYNYWQSSRFNVLMAGGRVDLAAEMLRETPEPADMQSLIRYLGMLRMLWRWDDIARIVEAMPPKQRREPLICILYFFALAELNRIPDLFTAAREMMAEHPNLGPNRHYFYLNPASHAGRVDLILSLLKGPLSSLNTPMKELWLSAALQRAGRHMEAQVILEKLKDAPSFLVQRSARERLQHPLPAVHLSNDQDAHEVLGAIEKDLREEDYYIVAQPSQRDAEPGISEMIAPSADNTIRGEHRAAAHRGMQSLHSQDTPYRPWVTWVLAASIAIVFVLDNFIGMETEPGLIASIQTWMRGMLPADIAPHYVHTFYQMGVYSYVHVTQQEQYWRLFTPLFLHINLVHLGFNTIALLSFGPDLERVLGRIRFLILYFTCGLAGTSAMTLMIHQGWMQPMFMLGASGCIMGLVGATAWILLYRSVWDNQAMAKEHLGQIALLLGLQTAFDLSNPQVSFTAHSLGALTGFLVAIILYRPRRHPAPPPAPGAPATPAPSPGGNSSSNSQAVTGTTS